MIVRKLLAGLVAVGLALAVPSALPALPKALEAMESWPEATQFALVDADGQVLWQPGAELTQDALAKAVAVMIVLTDGTSYLVEVKVEGEGEGLGEVQLIVDGKRVPLPALLHAKGFVLEDGKLVWSRGSKSKEEGTSRSEGFKEEGTSRSAPGGGRAKGGDDARHGRGR